MSPLPCKPHGVPRLSFSIEVAEQEVSAMPSRSGRCGRPFTKQAASQEHKQKAKIFEDDQWWFAPRKAARYCDTSQETLQKWKLSCPWLDTQGIQTRGLEGGYNRIITYYSKNDLNRVNEAKTRPLIPEVPELVYIQDAATELNCSMRTLRRLMIAKNETVRKVSAKEKPSAKKKEKPSAKKRRRRTQRALKRSYVTREFVDECKREIGKDQGARQPDKITVREAGIILGFSVQGVHSLITRGILVPSPSLEKIPCNGGYLRGGLHLLSRAEVEAYRDRRANAESERLEKAGVCLREILADGERRLRAQVIQQMDESDFRYTLIHKAARKLGVKYERPKFAGPGYWRLPTGNGQGAPRAIGNGQEQKAAPGNGARGNGRKRPAEDAHETWFKWREEGSSYGKIAARWKQATGDEVSKDAVKMAIKRFRKRLVN